MSYAYGYAVNDIIAVLGLFERIAIELRNFKNAPAHFQQLGAEVDLLQNAMRHALRLIPQNDAHRDTLERVRAIVMHCLTPLQALVHKMRTKESSLGHFRTSKSLSHIGTRIHWSMIAKQDIDEVRITITSETVAINMLLIAQSLAQIRQLTDCVQGIGDAQSALIKTHSDALIKQTSSILSLVSTMPDTIADLKLTTIMNDKKQSEQARMLEHGLAAVASHVGSLSQIGVKVSGALSLHTASMRRSVRRLLSLMRDIKELFVLLATYSRDILEAIGQNTRALLNIASQMKRIIRAIEAIPLHLTLDIVRLDDALGESWALPIQACQSWKSFYNLLSTVVYTKDRPGSNRIWTMQFALTMADGGTELEEFNWERVIKPGIHIEQAMIVTRVGASTEACHECSDISSRTLAKRHGKPCSTCGRWVGRRKRIVEPVVKLLDTTNTLPDATSALGPELPSMRIDEELHHFRRIQIRESSGPIHDIDTAEAILRTDFMDPVANTFLALRLIQLAEEDGDPEALEMAIEYLEDAISSDSTAVDPWYLLAEISMLQEDYDQASKYFQQAVIRKPRSPQISISMANMYYYVEEFRNSLDAIVQAIRLNPYFYMSWYNLGILYDACDQTEDAYLSFERCLQLNPDLPDVQARLDVLAGFRNGEKNIPDDYKIYDMLQCELMAMVDLSDNIDGAEIVFNPIIEAENNE
ncbi:hypothetical protein N5P37_000248 [Trichoderma harzianum]|uniref:Ubiquitin-like domain-containing protein n=1 Tax=Trichoderma harzianum CBS 226.95 TaxID=983964 RepID=A0A2T4A1G2_TRIHA|nr:hypothetical protein M431DRAFT_511795 [Trichoderma harzianum CBS 226.95]KAK0766523.1 hypothetical protein N5P37_000248 [Trichoderma harzianum]PTB50904.1 hypothetical protein M431DRAFT_511795 [Trichoderma harzianum CBS 226.95]